MNYQKIYSDYFANTNHTDQLQVLEELALLNKAYKTFTNKDATIKYILKEKGLLEDDEKYQLENSFLMQMMEINEEFSEAGLPDAETTGHGLSEKLIDLQNEIYEPVKNIIENYKEGITTKEELLQIKTIILRKKYIDRLTSQLSQKL